MSPAAATTISTLGLVSRFAGYQALVWASFSHFPEFFTKLATKPNFPTLTWFLFACWIAADILHIVSLVRIGGLETQLVMSGWYLAGDLVLLVQQFYYCGLLPYTARYQARQCARLPAAPIENSAPDDEAKTSTFYRLTQNASSGTLGAFSALWSSKSRVQSESTLRGVPSEYKLELGVASPQTASLTTPKGAFGTEQHLEIAVLPVISPKYSELELEEAEKCGSPTELEPSAAATRQSHYPARDKPERQTRMQRLINLLFDRYKHWTYVTVIVVLSIILAVVWLLRFYLPRHTVPPVGHALPPFVNGKVNNHNDAFLGWMAGWAGTVLYNVPRAHILYDSIKNKRPPPSEPWMFGALVGENLLTTVSILVVAFDGGNARQQLLAESPFLASILLALAFDVIWIMLRRIYRSVKSSPESQQV